MSVSYYVRCGIGIKLTKQEVATAFKDKAHKERGCDHTIKSGENFCSQCGRPAYIVEELKPYELLELLQKMGFDVLDSTDEEYMVVGKRLSDDINGRGYKPIPIAQMNTTDELVLRGDLKNKLEPLGLYKTETYGQWLVMMCF